MSKISQSEGIAKTISLIRCPKDKKQEIPEIESWKRKENASNETPDWIANFIDFYFTFVCLSILCRQPARLGCLALIIQHHTGKISPLDHDDDKHQIGKSLVSQIIDNRTYHRSRLDNEIIQNIEQQDQYNCTTLDNHLGIVIVFFRFFRPLRDFPSWVNEKHECPQKSSKEQYERPKNIHLNPPMHGSLLSRIDSFLDTIL